MLLALSPNNKSQNTEFNRDTLKCPKEAVRETDRQREVERERDRERSRERERERECVCVCVRVCMGNKTRSELVVEWVLGMVPVTCHNLAIALCSAQKKRERGEHSVA